MKPIRAADADAPSGPPALNRLALTAQLIERGAVRYTPAGLPALDLLLQHASTVLEDGLPRKVSVEIKALAIGAITRRMTDLEMGAVADFDGFLTQARNGRGLLLHVTALALRPQAAAHPIQPD